MKTICDVIACVDAFSIEREIDFAIRQNRG